MAAAKLARWSSARSRRALLEMCAVPLLITVGCRYGYGLATTSQDGSALPGAAGESSGAGAATSVGGGGAGGTLSGLGGALGVGGDTNSGGASGDGSSAAGPGDAGSSSSGTSGSVGGSSS